MEYANTERDNLTTKGCLRGLLIVIASVILATGGCVTYLEVRCYNLAADYFVAYPGATLTDESHNMFRPLGIGETVRIYASDDDPTTIRTWYNSQGLPTRQRTAHGAMIRELIPDGETTFIVIEARCAASTAGM